MAASVSLPSQPPSFAPHPPQTCPCSTAGSPPCSTAGGVGKGRGRRKRRGELIFFSFPPCSTAGRGDG